MEIPSGVPSTPTVCVSLTLSCWQSGRTLRGTAGHERSVRPPSRRSTALPPTTSAPRPSNRRLLMAHARLYQPAIHDRNVP